MDFLKILWFSFSSIIVLFLLAKLMGFRQISEMSFFDYIVGITIGSIAAEMATNLEIEWWKPITAMVIYGGLSYILSIVSRKSINGRRIISGTPIILIEKGQINKKALKKARMEIDDLLTHARTCGYFDLSNVDFAILETTGAISFLPTPQQRPLTPKDFNFAPIREGLYVNVIIDGKIMDKDLKYANVTDKELKKMLANRNKSVENILLATIDANKQLTIFDK